MCVKGIDSASCCDFSIGFYNCSDSVIFVCLFSILLADNVYARFSRFYLNSHY